MNKSFRRIISTALGIISVGFLLYVAIRFPEYYCAYTDKNTLNNMVITDIKVQTYETAYTSFAEKIYAIAQARDSGNILSAVRMNETEVNPGRKELTKIVKEEIKKMKEYGIIFTVFKPKAKNMITCERYTIYAANEHDNLKGISCWKLEYENKKRTITIYLDEEYHKIYSFEINQKLETIVDKETSNMSAASTVFYDGSVDYSEIPYMWWNGMIRYYDLSTYQSFMDGGVEYYDMKTGMIRGKIEFESLMEPFEVYLINSSNMETVSFKVGILMEKMIQF